MIIQGIVLVRISYRISLPELPIARCEHIDTEEKIGYSVGEYRDDQTSCVVQDQTIGYTRHNTCQPEVVLQTKENG